MLLFILSNEEDPNPFFLHKTYQLFSFFKFLISALNETVDQWLTKPLLFNEIIYVHKEPD